MEKQILLLGNPALYQISEICEKDEMPQINQIKEDLKDTLIAFRNRHGVGRAIAAPQIGVAKRIIYRHLDTPLLMINPRMEYPDEDLMEVLDDCMSFPAFS